MSYHISLLNNIVCVRFCGSVDGLQLVQLMNDEAFLPQLDKYGKAIFDYSHTDDVSLDYDETKSFATLGKIHANFIEQLHIVIALSGPDGFDRADFYRKNIASPNWQIDIVENFEQALELLKDA